MEGIAEGRFRCFMNSGFVGNFLNYSIKYIWPVGDYLLTGTQPVDGHELVKTNDNRPILRKEIRPASKC